MCDDSAAKRRGAADDSHEQERLEGAAGYGWNLFVISSHEIK